MLENDTSTINPSPDISFSSHESDGDDYDIAEIVNSIISTNAIVAAATVNLIDELYDNQTQKKKGGSLPGKATNKRRDFGDAYHRLVIDYFSGVNSVYNEVDFERRFRINRGVFVRIYETLLGKGKFIQRSDALGKQGIHPLVRMVACLRYLAYGSSYDTTDEQIPKSSIISSSTLLIAFNMANAFLRSFPLNCLYFDRNRRNFFSLPHFFK
jgi:hypothetical protein